jgi:hypothetical protein
MEDFKERIIQAWDDLPQTTIDHCIDAFRKRLHAVIRVNGGHIEHFV